MYKVYKTADNHYVEEGETIFWFDSHSGRWNKSCFNIEYRYGVLYEIILGFERGGYTTRYSIDELENEIYKNIPEGEHYDASK